MLHYPITEALTPKEIIEFSHIINPSANSGTWNVDNVICLDHVKINVFVSGDFSLIIGSEAFSPKLGDICILPPQAMHFGKITQKTKLDYYQLDIGLGALDKIPCGEELIKGIISIGAGGIVFNSAKSAEDILLLCRKLEAAIREERLALAFAYTVEFLEKIRSAYTAASSSSVNLSKITKATISFIESSFDEDIKIEAIASSLGVSTSYLSRLFKREVGVGVHEYLVSYRVLMASTMLKEGRTVLDVCYACGFCDSSHFISTFKKIVGTTPNEYRKKFI